MADARSADARARFHDVAPPRGVIQLEFHQLDRRYEPLRRAEREQEKHVLASLARIGQQTPVVVVAGADGAPFVLVDGYKRVRSLIRLRADTVRATCWALLEADALLLERLMRVSGTDTPLEQGWLLKELRDRFSLTGEELARRFDRSPGWISGRLGLVADLPEPIQDQVRRGEITAHAAMRYLVPFARVHPADAIRLAQAIGPLRPSSRQTEALCAAYLSGSDETRALVLSDPGLLLRARETARGSDSPPRTPAALLLDDLGALACIARRAHRRLRESLAPTLTTNERDEVLRALQQAMADAAQLFHRLEKEFSDARPEDPSRDPRTT